MTTLPDKPSRDNDENFVIVPRQPARETFYVKLRPATLERLNELEKLTAVRRAEIVQQALDYALERLEL